VLSINDDPVSIKQIELAIVEKAWEEGWIVARPPESRTGRSVGVVGSGPAGLAAAAHLNRAGHDVVVYERDEGPGGLLRFGVPDFKLEKHYIDRRIALLEEEGVRFAYGVDVGADVSAAELEARHDAVVLAIGSRVHRTLDVPGADLAGVRFAMDYLYARNRWVAARSSRSPPTSCWSRSASPTRSTRERSSSSGWSSTAAATSRRRRTPARAPESSRRATRGSASR
jgi:glutamate synthase (NADPH/NADH) small chain